MPDNNKKIALSDWSNIEPEGSADKLGYTGAVATAFGNTDFGETRYDEDTLPSQHIKDKKYEALRGEKQGWGAELANAIGGGIAKIPFSVIGNTASMLDFEDYYNTDKEVGNAITAWAEEAKGNIEDATKIYKSNDNTLGSREWWMNNGKGLIDSAGGFILTGGALGKGIQLLSNLTKGSEIIQGIGTVTNAAMLNQAESIPMAMGVYQKSYDIESAKYAKQLEDGTISKEEVDQKSKQAASDAAAYSININRLNIPLNLTSVGAFLRPIQLTRQVAKDVSKKEILAKLLSEGSQEYLEEDINNIAENEALRKAKDGNNYTYNFNNTVKDVFSKEGFEAGIIGFLGGIVQTGGTDLLSSLQKDSPSYDIEGNVRTNEDGSPVLVNTHQSQKERFKAQQKSLNNIELLSKTEGVPTVKETLNKIKDTATILNDIQEASINNNEYKVEDLQNDLLINQATDAFKNGTTEQLINTYKSINQDPTSKDKFGKDYQTKSHEAIKQIEDLEKVYNDHNSLPQVSDIVANRAKYSFNLNQADAIKQEILKSQVNQQRELEITGFTTPEQISTLSSTKDLQNLQSKFDEIKNNVISLNDNYNEILSDKYTQKVIKDKQIEVSTKESNIENTFKEPTQQEIVDSIENTPVNNQPIDQLDEHLNTLTDESQVIEALNNTELSQSEKGDRFEKWATKRDAINNGTQPVVNTPIVTPEPVIIPEIKSTSDKHQVLNTSPNLRDTQVLYTKDGVEHLVGEHRGSSNNQLGSFEDVRKALEYFNTAEKPNTLVNFNIVNGFVMLNIAGVNISTISKYGGSPEQKAINELFYNQDGSPKSIESITELFDKGVIQLDLAKHLNTLLKDDTKPTLGKVFDMLTKQADTVKLKEGIIDISLEGETEIKDYNPAVEEARENLSDLQSDIAEGLHMEVVINGRVDVIKVKTKTNPNAQQSFDIVVNEIANAQGDTKLITQAIDKFNKEIFFALEPIEGVVRKFQLNYAKSTNTFYFTLQTKNKDTGTYSAPVQMKNNAGINILNNIHPSLLSADYIIEQLADSNVNKSVKFTAKNIRYSSFLNENNEVDTNKLEVYVDPNGLFKYGVQFSINAEAKPLTTEVTPVVEVKPTETPKQETKVESSTKLTARQQSKLNAQKAANDSKDIDEVYTTGLKESTGITSEEVESIKKILPRFISIEDIKTIANNLKVKGIPYGVFKNKVIYLNITKGKPGTAYHEAFHAVFRTMLTDAQIEKYYKAGYTEFKKSGKNLKQEVTKLQNTVVNYANKTQAELEALVIEEFMADKFMDYSMNKNQAETGNTLKQLFFKIKNFFKELFNIGEELDMLYADILKGKFVNSEALNNTYFNSNETLFKLLPKKNTSQDNGFFNASDSRKIISYFAIQIYKAKSGNPQDHLYAYKDEKNANGEYVLKSDEELLDFFIVERLVDLDTKGEAYIESIFDSNPELGKELDNKVASEKYLYNKENINNAKIRPYDVLKSAVEDKLAIFKFKTAEEANEAQEGGQEATHMKDTFGSQDSFLSGGHDSLSQTIKKYVAFTTKIEIDEITNEEREVGIDEVALYNGLTSVLADTSEDRMIAKLYDASESNSNIKAFYEQIIVDLGITFDAETRTTSYPTNPEAYNISRAILTNFKNSKATQIDVLFGESWTKDANGNNVKVKANTWVNTNKNDARKISLERWKTKVTFISRQKSIKEFQHNFSNVDKVVNNYYKGNVSLDKASKDIKQLLDTNGINLTSIYIKISLAKQKAILKPDDLITKDKNFISIYDTTEPIDFKMFGAAALNDGFSIINVIDKDLKALFDEDNGVLGRLGTLAENNAKFDESIANFSFTNAEGKRVYEIIKPSYVLTRPELYKKDSYWESVEKGEGLTEVEEKNTYFLRDNYLVTKHKGLLKNLKINILSGFRDTTTTTQGLTKDGVTFGSFDSRTYLLSAVTLYHNKGNKNTGKYMFRQNEASSTGYVAELPKIDVNSVAGQQEITNYFLNQVTKEWNRIKREKKAFDKKPGDLKKYNDSLKGRAFDFTEFQYLKDTLGTANYEALVKSALDPEIKELTTEQKTLINKGVRNYLNSSFKDFKQTIEDVQLRLFLTPELKGESATYDQLLWEFYVNDYIMSNSLNELMDGDYALSRKDKVDISKRNKGAMASGPDFGRGVHTSAIIKDIDLFTSTILIDNKIVRVKPEFDENDNLIQVTDESGKVLDLTKDQVASYTSNDAMSYASQYHMIMGAFRLGRVDGKTREAYKDIIQFTKKVDGKIVRNINIGDETQKHLSESLASLNSKKTIVFDGINGQYLKMSELAFVRSSVSYIEDKDVDSFVELTDNIFNLMTKDDYESDEFRDNIKKLAKLYKPVPGMEYWHKLANNMDLHGIDHLAVESASKGATRSPQDSQSDDLDLSKSKFKVSNANKRLQVETPTGKKEIVTGSQILTLIASELKDSEKVNGVKLGELRKQYNKAIADTRDTSFKKAMKVIKEVGDGTIDKTLLEEVVKRSLAASGADEQLLEFFDSSMNYNMVQMITKAEQTILSYFSKGVLNQKVNGDKVSLATDAGIKVVRNIQTGKVVSHHEVIQNPSKYSDITKYEQSALKYNVEEGDLKYSECMLSQTILTRHGLKIGDTITPEMTEVLKMLGYRIPTGDKQSAMSLKVVSLLPDYYNGIGIFPSEIVHLSGADFDIDSEFIQMPYFWYKQDAPTVPIKYGTEQSDDDKFEGFKYYNRNLNKDFSRVYKQFLNEGNSQNEAYKQASIQLELPYDKKTFLKSGIVTNAINNNIALDRMISMLANNHTAEIANNTTSTDVLANLKKDLIEEGFVKSIKSDISQKNKSASDVNGKYDSNTKNSAGKEGIGIAANKIQQFALLMSKVGDKVVKFNKDSFKFEIAGEKGGSYSAVNKDGQRIANNLNILLNVFTDNAKDPIAGELNIQFELLGGFTELIMQGMSFENTVKFINLPIIQNYGKVQKALKSKIKTEIEESFSKSTAQAAAIVMLENGDKVTKDLINKVGVDKLNPEISEVQLKQIEAILLGKEFTKELLGDSNTSTSLEVQYQALNQFVKVQDQYNTMATLNTFLTLNQGLDTSFTDLNQKLRKAIDTFKLNKVFDVEDSGSSVTDEPHIDIFPILLDDTNTFGNIERAIEVSKKVGQKIFIEQTELFTKEFSKIFDSLKDEFKNVNDNVAKISKEFLGYISIKSYLDNLEELKSSSDINEARKEAINIRLNSINLGLIFNELNKEGKINLVSQLELLKTNEATKDNYIVKYFTVKESIIDTKSFVKESNETISLLIDSVKSLYFDNTTQLNESGLTPRAFVDNMLSYLMVKDNMVFKNNSVAKYLPVNMFGKYSEILDGLVKDLVTKKVKINFAEAAYNFRKLYLTDINTTYAALKSRSIKVTEKGPIRLNGENLEFSISSNTEEELKSSKQELFSVFSEQLITKTPNALHPTYKFPQFIKVRQGKGEVKVYELVSFVNKNTSGFINKKDDFLNYIDATEEVNHNTENAYAAGEKATYKPLEVIGEKGISVFFPGTYEQAKIEFDKIKPKEADTITNTTTTEETDLSTLKVTNLDEADINIVDIKSLESEKKVVPLIINLKIQKLKLKLKGMLEEGDIDSNKYKEVIDIIDNTDVTNDEEFGELLNKLCS